MQTVWFDRLLLVLALVLTAVVLLAPVVFMPALVFELFELGVLPTSSDSAGAAVGVGVILRSALRRVLQTGVRNVMQTSMGTFARATARAVTRRVLRIATKSALLLFRADAQSPKESEETSASSFGSCLALLIGSLVLAGSFWVILWMLPPEKQSIVVAKEAWAPASSNVDRSAAMSLPLAAFLGALPMWIYAGIAFASTRWARVGLTFQTGFDSIAMQAYFTGSGSFLPLCTDSEYDGTPRQCALAAFLSLGGMLGLHLLLQFLHAAFDMPILLFSSRMILLYTFIFSFPILPLDGAHLWRHSKMLWLTCWLVILIAFMMHIPESFNVIL